jgi:hypothetical protein
VTTNLANIPALSDVKDADLPKLFDNNDCRQLIHITYGQILTNKNADGGYTYRDRLYKFWAKEEDVYSAALVAHIGKHLDLLGVPKQ